MLHPEKHPVWARCGMCNDPVWANENQSMEPGYHALCYADQVEAIDLRNEQLQEEELQDDYDPGLYDPMYD